ncbi:uncharacterized protein L3040_008758 [Drepanopeziza brunnea f. sp. 'multigermtubi']|uniref:uncharacterized protein n=1 Tax=Drepanopeziza brunnea f. sp. 'multigermtubi' TaxID=698441 RepID=UPI0023A230E1|nr:hypothetical protein L3040_008758 [Drepanopeziza brunnea f. sp. 'multigermtubi']
MPFPSPSSTPSCTPLQHDADNYSSPSSLSQDYRSSLSTDTLLSDTDDLEKDESSPLYKDAPRKLPLQKAFSSTYKALLTVLILLPWALLPMMYKLGYRSGASVLPKLPTHDITARAVKHHLEILDDEFYTTKPENLKYKGIPRPELDDAWNELIANVNQRVNKDEAKKAGFESTELADGSGDLYGMPAVFHNLHCLYALRRSMFPNVYVEDPDVVPPGPNQINVHADHCFDIIRQAIMCQGDMSLYYFYWPKTAQSATRSYPRHVGHREHVCVDWDHLQRETSKTRFSILGEEKLLVNPVNPAASLNNVVRPMFKNYSVYDGVDIPELKLFEGLEDGGLEELQQMAKAGGRR